MPTKAKSFRPSEHAVAATLLHGTLTKLAYLELTDQLTTAELEKARACLQAIVSKHPLPKLKRKYA